MLKRKLSKAEFDALSDALKAVYKADGDSYVLQVETSADDDPGELRRALIREKQDAKDQKARADRLQTQLDDLVADPNKQKDLKTLEDSWKQKLTDKETEFNKQKERLTEKLKKTLVSDVAKDLAHKLAGDNAAILLPHIAQRLQADFDGDSAQTRVLDKDGKISAATIEDLEKEFVANKTFSAIIVASKASGGASSDGKPGPTAVPKDKKFQELTEQERVAWFKSDPEGFRKAKEAAQRV